MVRAAEDRAVTNHKPLRRRRDPSLPSVMGTCRVAARRICDTVKVTRRTRRLAGAGRDVPVDSRQPSLAEVPMRRIGLAVALTFSLTLVPLGEAQQMGRVYRVGFLALLPGEDAVLMKALKERLHELGYIDGRNMIFEYRAAEGRQDRLGELAAELAQGRPDVLIAGAGTLAPLALKRATTTIPIVFASVGDPVGAGVVTSLSRAGGNVTGITGQSADLGGKRLQLLRELVPGGDTFAVLANPATPFAQLALNETKVAAEILHVRLEILELKTSDQTASRFETAVKAGAAGLL